MIPIKDTVPRRTFPFVTFGLIALNSLVFPAQLSLPEPSLNDLVHLFGLVPARYTHPSWAVMAGLPLDTYWPFVTNMFLHGGSFHLIANMWSLYLFGDNVEDRLGRLRFFLFNHDSTVPVIGYA